jgi:hypothetical protein
MIASPRQDFCERRHVQKVEKGFRVKRWRWKSEKNRRYTTSPLVSRVLSPPEAQAAVGAVA